MEKTLYEVLGLEKNATPEQIKKAYRKLAQQHHPDKDGGDGDREQFQLVKEAYEVLSDPERRARYDHDGSYRHAPRETEEQRINAMALNILRNLLHKIIEETDFIEHTNILDNIVSEVGKLDATEKKSLESNTKSKEKLEKAQARLKSKNGGENFAALSLQFVIDHYAGEIRKNEEHMKISSRLKELIEGHEYEVDEPDEEAKAKMRAAGQKRGEDMLAKMLGEAFGKQFGGL